MITARIFKFNHRNKLGIFIRSSMSYSMSNERRMFVKYLPQFFVNRKAYFIGDDKIKKPSLDDDEFKHDASSPTETYEKASKEIIERGRRKAEEKEVKHNPVLVWTCFAILSMGCGVLLYVLKDVTMRKIEGITNENTQSIGLALIGGPFQMTDMNGNSVTEDDFKGNWTMLYFGFTHCPDVCPDTLDKISKVMKALERASDLPKMNVLFVSVDPARDTVPAIKHYLQDFHPNIIGLTGSDENVKRICKNFRIYYSAGPKDQDQDYVVDHTTFCFLMNPAWKYASHYGPDMNANEIKTSITNHMRTYKKTAD